MIEELLRHRSVWQKKTSVRFIYKKEFFPRLRDNCVPGKRTLEIGGGPGFYKEFEPSVISSDFIVCPWHDLALDAQFIPCANNSLDNVVALDVLHHMDNPIAFLSEIERILRSGGRLVMIEPWISALGYIINKYMMPEDCDLDWKPGETFTKKAGKEKKQPFEANSAFPFLLFTRFTNELEEIIPLMRIRKLETFSFLGYLLSMGFREVTLLPSRLCEPVSRIETMTRPLWKNFAALKVLIVMEKK
jgi:SAM-dependent methyltransferase